MDLPGSSLRTQTPSNRRVAVWNVRYFRIILTVTEQVEIIMSGATIFDTFLSGIMSGNSAINNVDADVTETTGKEVMYDFYGRQVPTDTTKNGIYIVRRGQKVTKILK